MAEYRLYIDESGDHTYRNLEQLERRYLGLTGVLFHHNQYNPRVPEGLEELKRKFFTYDPDRPPIFVRQQLINKRGAFGVLREAEVNEEWEEALLSYLRRLRAQIFTVVIDKKEHEERYVEDTWNPYDYAFGVLLNRVGGWLNLRDATADIMPEARGATEDNQLLAAYVNLHVDGLNVATANHYKKAFPDEDLKFRRKDHNVAGLQIADLVAAEQKMLTVQEAGRPLASPIGPFGLKINRAIRGKVNPYGRYFLE